MSKHLSFLCLLFSLVISNTVYAQQAQVYYQLKIYSMDNKVQLEQTHHYLKEAFLPAAHQAGMTEVGVFIPIDVNDLKIYVLTCTKSADRMLQLEDWTVNEVINGKEYLSYAETKYNAPPYARIETVFLKAFLEAPILHVPALTSPKNERVYELRSYESPTEGHYRNKVEMFNEGGEISLFKRLNFNAVFYGEVLAGRHMPNLMYMTSFNSIDDRNAHWNAFSEDEEWKKLSGMEKYQNNVSKNTIVLLHPTAYSDL